MNERDWANLADIVTTFAEARPTASALSFEGRVTDWQTLAAHVGRVANALVGAGIGKGDRIAYLGKNSDIYFEILLGAARIGAVVAPIGWRLSVAEIAHILGDTEAKALFASRELVAEGSNAIALLGHDMLKVAAEEPAPGWLAYPAWRDTMPDAVSVPSPGLDDIVLQLYTSGTTGHPKGVMLSNANLILPHHELKAAGLAWNKWDDDDVALVTSPISHVGGTNWCLMALRNGAKSVIVRDFDPDNVLDYIVRERISKIFLVPSAMQIVLRDPRCAKTDFSRLKHIRYGASPIPPALLREAMDMFGCGFVQMYGMTEACGSVAALGPEEHVDDGSNPRMASAGRALPGCEIKIVDGEGQSVPAGTVGEISVRGSGVMAGYWKRSGATAEAIDVDGWLRTGDAGYLDDDGYVYIHDRVNDMIISGGENIYPAEVEAALFAHPAVREASVIGVPDDRWGEAVKAIVIREPGSAATAEDIIEFARSRIARFKAPKSIDFVEDMPRTASGKVMRRRLREPYWQGQVRGVN
jgi:long-chain acyl-CoA synthetase